MDLDLKQYTVPSVVLMAYGSPKSLDSVGEYLTHIRGGRRPSQEDVDRLREKYRRVGGQTPLLQVTTAQSEVLQEKFRSESVGVRVHFGMKHWHPFVEDVVAGIALHNAPLIVGVALVPQYSRLSIRGYQDGVARGLAREGPNTPFVMVKSWHTQPSLISALARRVRSGTEKTDDHEDTVVVFTAHSLPKNEVAIDDPYEAQLMETSRLVAGEAGVKNWEFAFQSVSGPFDAWLGPTLKDKISELAAKGVKRILVCPVGFVSDHLEILYDLDIEAKEYAASLGVTLRRTASLNDDPGLIEALASAVRPVLAARTIPASVALG